MVEVRRPLITELLMDTTQDLADLEVLTDDELALVVGGVDVRKFDAKDFVYNKIGMCGCGLTH
jgi:bacteriocin-like protein